MDLDGNMSACWFHCEQKEDESTCHSGKAESYLCTLQLVAKNTFNFLLIFTLLKVFEELLCSEAF